MPVVYHCLSFTFQYSDKTVVYIKMLNNAYNFFDLLPPHQAPIETEAKSGLVWFGLMLYVQVNNFSVMLGRSHRFLGIIVPVFIYFIYFFFFLGGGGWGVNMSCSRTQNGDPSMGLEPPTSGSGVRGVKAKSGSEWFVYR